MSFDPGVSWATYLGGSGTDYGRCVALDTEGNALLVGQTGSSDMPQANNAFHGGTYDAFVAKVTSAGTLAWVTYLGGSGVDNGSGIALDGQGNILVTGSTNSSDFEGAPTGSYHGGSNDAFVAKLNSDGKLVWATLLGGSGYEYGNAIAVDGDGNALVTGYTTSTDFAGASNGYNGGSTDAFVAKVSSDGTKTTATYVGGSGSDYGYGIAVDSGGNALVTGYTSSTDFAGASNAFHGGSTDAFVAKVSGVGMPTAATTATYVGGSGYDYGYGIAVDGAGNALVTGYTTSTDFAGASNAFHGGSTDAFVAKVPGDGTAATATYVGGSGSDYGYGIAVDGSGNALVTGYTTSTDFAGANNVDHGGASDAFVAEVSSAGPLARATYLGGSGADYGRSIALDTDGNALVTGYTSSTDLTGADNANHGGTYDAFLRKLDPMFQEWPGIVVDPISGLTTTEGGATATFHVRLTTQPTADVTIGFSSSDTTEGTVSPASLTFTPGNWNVAQTVTVTGVDDTIYDGNVAYTILTGPATSDDSDYNGLNPADVSVTNKDNDMTPAVTFGGPGDDMATGVATDAAGNVYVTGSFQNTVDFNPDPSAAYNLTVVGSNASNDFVASYSPSGAFRWAHQIGGGTTPSIAVAAGNVLVSASFSGAADFDPSHPGSHKLTSRGGNDEFLLKLDANTGNFQWVQQIGGSGNESSGGIAMGPDGNLYLAGNTSSGTDLTFGSLRPSGSGGLYITKVNPSTGQFLWATRTGTNANVTPNSIAVDSANSIYVAGSYTCSQQFGSRSITLVPHGNWDAFLLKTDSTGKPLWADGFGAAGGSAHANAVAVDSAGSVYLTGSFNPSLDSYSNTNLAGTKGILTSAGGDDAFVLKVKSDGSLLAKQRMGGPSIWGDWGAGIAVDSASGLVYVKGGFYLDGDFGSQVFASRYGWWDSFVAKLKTADLSFVQTYHFGCSADHGGGIAIAAGATGPVYVAGTYSWNAMFPAGDYHSIAENSDAFVMKLNPSAAMISGRVFADVNSNGKADDGVATPGPRTVFLDANGNGTLDPGELSTTTYGDQGYYEFYGLDPGNYNVVEVPAAGWTPTTPVSRAVTLGAGQSAVVDFGNYFPTQTSTYASTAAPVAIKSSTTTTMPITVTDSYSILDLNVTVNLTYRSLSDLTVTLIAPNGTRVTLAGGSELSGANFTGTTFDDEAAKWIGQGTAPYTGVFRPDGVQLQWFDFDNIQGQWVLEINDSNTARSGSFFNSWSMTVIHQPTTQTMQAMSAMASAGPSTTLTDAALAAYAWYEHPSQPDDSKDKPSPAIPAVDLALLELGV